MAIAVGDRVRGRLTSAALGAVSRLQPEPPVLGVCTRVNGGGVSLVFKKGEGPAGATEGNPAGVAKTTPSSSPALGPLPGPLGVGGRARGGRGPRPLIRTG